MILYTGRVIVSSYIVNLAAFEMNLLIYCRFNYITVFFFFISFHSHGSLSWVFNVWTHIMWCARCAFNHSIPCQVHCSLNYSINFGSSFHLFSQCEFSSLSVISFNVLLSIFRIVYFIYRNHLASSLFGFHTIKNSWFKMNAPFRNTCRWVLLKTFTDCNWLFVSNRSV